MSWALLVVVVVVVVVVIPEAGFVACAWVVFGSVRRMDCSLDCRRGHGLVLLWALVCVGALVFRAPISVKGSRHFWGS